MAASDRDRFDVFISHSTRLHADHRELLGQLVALLEKRGLAVFLDRAALEPGTALLPALEDAVRRSRVGVVVVSERALASGWVALEIEEMTRRRLAGRMRLLAVCMDDSRPPAVAGDVEVCELRSFADLAAVVERIGALTR